jgi:hypothetical protein
LPQCIQFPGASTGNVGVNIGVPAPMAYFPFSGWTGSFFGVMHAQGRGPWSSSPTKGDCGALASRVVAQILIGLQAKSPVY